MKRGWLAAIIVISFVAILIGNFSWNKQVEKTVREAQERISGQISKDPEIEKSTKQKEASSEESSSKSEQNAQGDTANLPTKQAPGESSTPTAEAEKSSSNSSETPSLESIKAEYNSLFKELEIQESSKADQLIVEAKADFVSGQSSEESLITKYQEVATLMEQNADSTFNILYEQLKYDLEANGYDTQAAEEYKQSYNQKKQERRSRIIKQIQNF